MACIQYLAAITLATLVAMHAAINSHAEPIEARWKTASSGKWEHAKNWLTEPTRTGAPNNAVGAAYDIAIDITGSPYTSTKRQS